MHVMYNKTAIDNWWPSSASSPSWHQHCDHVAHHTRDQSCVARPRISGLAFITDDVAKMLKNPTYFCLQWTPLGDHRPV